MRRCWPRGKMRQALVCGDKLGPSSHGEHSSQRCAVRHAVPRSRRGGHRNQLPLFQLRQLPAEWLEHALGRRATSVFPELVLSQPDGSYRFHTPFTIDMPGTYGDIAKTGGWAAATQNAANPAAFALGLVFGRDRHWPEQLQLQREDAGLSALAHRLWCGRFPARTADYTVMDVSSRVNILPGESFYRRVFMVVGTLNEVAEDVRKLESFADYHPMDFTEADTPLLPLDTMPIDKGQIVPSLAAPSPDARAALPSLRTAGEALEAALAPARSRHRSPRPFHRSRAAQPQGALRQSLPRRQSETRRLPEPCAIRELRRPAPNR